MTIHFFLFSELKATYHLGNARDWAKQDSAKQNTLAFDNAFKLSEVWSKHCQFNKISIVDSPPIVEGTNGPCARLAYKFWCEGYDPCKVANCTNVAELSPRSKKCRGSSKTGKWLPWGDNTLAGK